MVKRRVEVNQRALVDKVLARYPEEFTVFRELLQNADDARAKEVQIEFQTSDYAKHVEGANGKVNGVNGAIPDLNTTILSKWIVRNNGDYFEPKDWGRLTKIADGNPDEQKIGAFGVGFYSVFSMTDSPVVKSGGNSLSLFFEGDQLFTSDDTCPQSEWTSIEMELKEDMRGPIPKPFDLARFLAATMTFMSCLKTTCVFFDGKLFSKIVKTRGVPSSIPLPVDMIHTSKGRTMNIKAVSVVNQDITVEITDWALAAGTKTSSGQRPDAEKQSNSIVKRKIFWGNAKKNEKNEAHKFTSPSRASTYERRSLSHTASFAVYSAEVVITPSEDLQKGLKAMTKKDLPHHFEFEMVYFSKEEHDARAAEEKGDSMGSVFRGPQGLFPQLDGDSEYMSRVFIGQSTAQTSGIGGHLSGRFIPTVERGSIDLSNSHIAKWNEELLYVGGFLARLVYEKEINRIWSTWPKDVLTDSSAATSFREKAAYAMRYFTFHPSTLDAKVSRILRDAFFACSHSDNFPIMSNYGIRWTKDVRQPNPDFSSFMKKMPVLFLTSPGDPHSLIDSLPERYQVRPYTFRDVVNELKGRTLQDDEVMGLLQWWVNVYEEVPNRDTVLAELTDAAKLRIGNLKHEVALSTISKFVDSSVWVPWLQSDDALPPDTIPHLFTRSLDRKKIPLALGWEPMTVVDWLSHLISPQIHSAHNIRTNASYSNKVLGILGNIWDNLSGDLKSDAKDLMEDVAWIATNKGLQRASDSYFQEADIFNDLPVVSANVFDRQIPNVLAEFGVKKRLDFDELFTKAEEIRNWSAEKMIRYLKGDPDCEDRLEDIQSRPVFPCENDEKHRITELYLPHKDIRELGLPVLQWPSRIDSDDEQMLTELGFLLHPPLDKLIEIAGSNDPKIQRAAFTYLSKRFDELYDTEYDPSNYEEMPFVPAIKDGRECVGAHEDVYSDHSWAMMGFRTVHPSVDRKTIGRLRLREAPSANQVIQTFWDSPPKDPQMAIEWFAFLATKQVLSPGDLQEVAKIPIVPVKDLASQDDSVDDSFHTVPPRECFFGGNQYPEEHLYRRVFTFVDFGDGANGFLKACGVKAKPDGSDIVNIIIKDPYDFLEKTNANGEEGPEKYLAELRSVAAGYEGMAEDDKRSMRHAPIFVGYHVSGSPNDDQSAPVKDEFQLVKASDILIADDLENRRIFGGLVWLAPQDELLEKLYESAGSKYLSSHIKYNVKPSKESGRNNWPCCESVRKAILEKLPIFLHDFDKQRLRDRSAHYSWEEESRFVVKGCRDLQVEKKLDSDYATPGRRNENFECHVSAEITTEANSPVTLWLKKADQVDMYDVAVALCRLLFKTHKKHDVLSLMTILETDKEVLRRRGYDVDMIKEAHKKAVLEDKKNQKERREEARKRQSEQHNNVYGGHGGFRFKFLDYFRWKMNGSKTANQVNPKDIDASIDEVLKQLGEGEATPEEIRNREHSGASKKARDVDYCFEQKSTDLDHVDVQGAAGLTKVWRQKTAREGIPLASVTEFANIIHGLCGVFNLSNVDNNTFNIFWHPEDPDLMGFNRNRLIFLNLAHYTVKHEGRPPGIAYIEWYYIIAHEIAHNKTPFHDEHHELLMSGLSSRFLPCLHNVEGVREYFKCA